MLFPQFRVLGIDYSDINRPHWEYITQICEANEGLKHYTYSRLFYVLANGFSFSNLRSTKVIFTTAMFGDELIAQLLWLACKSKYTELFVTFSEWYTERKIGSKIFKPDFPHPVQYADYTTTLKGGDCSRKTTIVRLGSKEVKKEVMKYLIKNKLYHASWIAERKGLKKHEAAGWSEKDATLACHKMYEAAAISPCAAGSGTRKAATRSSTKNNAAD